MPLIDWPLGWTVVADVAAWCVIGVTAGYGAHRLAPARLAQDGWLTRLRPIEADGRWYERAWHIRRWKRHLPEAGGLFPQGFSKRSLRAADVSHLERFVIETRRAEVTHWAVLAAGPFFVLWNPWGLALVMVSYAVVANVPCIAVQRYNRARLRRVIRTTRARPNAGEPTSNLVQWRSRIEGEVDGQRG